MNVKIRDDTRELTDTTLDGSVKTALFPRAIVSVSAKGQITIPRRIRAALGFTPGARLIVTLVRGGFALQVFRKEAQSG